MCWPLLTAYHGHLKSWKHFFCCCCCCCHDKCLRSLILNLWAIWRPVCSWHVNKIRPGNVLLKELSCFYKEWGCWECAPCCVCCQGMASIAHSDVCGCVCPWYFKKKYLLNRPKRFQKSNLKVLERALSTVWIGVSTVNIARGKRVNFASRRRHWNNFFSC